MSSIREMTRPFVRRARRQALWRGATLGACAGAAALAVVLLIGRFREFSAESVGVVVFAACVAVGGSVCVVRVPSVGSLLSKLDADFGLKDRIRTAWELEATGDQTLLATAQIEDARRRLSNVTPAMWMPRLAPRFAWFVPFAVALAWTPLLIPSRVAAFGSITEAERRVVAELANASDADATTQQALNDARSVEEAMRALADAERRAERAADAQRALDAANETLRSFMPQDATSTVDALNAVAKEPPPELTEELRALRDKLVNSASSRPLFDALVGIETANVSAEKLKEIIAALRELETQAKGDATATLNRIREQKRKLAAVALETRRGNIARLDQVAGSESADSAATGAELGDAVERSGGATTLTLETMENESALQTSVYSRNPGAGLNSEAALLPFREAALRASEDAARAIDSGALPIAYRDRIGRYFQAIASAARETE